MSKSDNWETIYKNQFEILEKLDMGNGWLIRNTIFAQYDYAEEAYPNSVVLTFQPKSGA